MHEALERVITATSLEVFSLDQKKKNSQIFYNRIQYLSGLGLNVEVDFSSNYY